MVEKETTAGSPTTKNAPIQTISIMIVPTKPPTNPNTTPLAKVTRIICPLARKFPWSGFSMFIPSSFASCCCSLDKWFQVAYTLLIYNTGWDGFHSMGLGGNHPTSCLRSPLLL
jgi:hypothetical protein